jgi:hypothetical protein
MRKLFSIFALLFICLLGAPSAKADQCNNSVANLIQNCAFGTGDFTGWSGTATADPFNGVDQGDPLAVESITLLGIANEAFLGSSSNEDLSQTFATTAGQQYTIEFLFLNDTSPSLGYPNDFTVLFGGTTIFSETNAPADGYMGYVFSTPATSSSTTLTFESENPSGDFELSSISVAATPEPGTLLLFGTGLLALAGATRRRLCR